MHSPTAWPGRAGAHRPIAIGWLPPSRPSHTSTQHTRPSSPKACIYTHATSTMTTTRPHLHHALEQRLEAPLHLPPVALCQPPCMPATRSQPAHISGGAKALLFSRAARRCMVSAGACRPAGEQRPAPPTTSLSACSLPPSALCSHSWFSTCGSHREPPEGAGDCSGALWSAVAPHREPGLPRAASVMPAACPLRHTASLMGAGCLVSKVIRKQANSGCCAAHLGAVVLQLAQAVLHKLGVCSASSGWRQARDVSSCVQAGCKAEQAS